MRKGDIVFAAYNTASLKKGDKYVVVDMINMVSPLIVVKGINVRNSGYYYPEKFLNIRELRCAKLLKISKL